MFVYRHHRCHTIERENEVRKQELANQLRENAALRAVQEASKERERFLSAIIERLNTEKAAAEAQSQALRDEILRITEERKQENDQ